jgi:hypothetical protein
MITLDRTVIETGGNPSSQTEALFFSVLEDSQFRQMTLGTSAAAADSSKK